MTKNKNLELISNRLDELITSDFIKFDESNIFQDIGLCIDMFKMYYECNTGSLDGFDANEILIDSNYLPKYESLIRLDKHMLEINNFGNSKKQYALIGECFITIYSYIILKFINKYVSAKDVLHLAHILIYNLDIIILGTIEIRKDTSYKNYNKFYLNDDDKILIPVGFNRNVVEIDYSKGIYNYIYDRNEIVKLCGYILGIDKYEHDIYLPIVKKIIQRCFTMLNNLMVLEEEYIAVCKDCGEIFITVSEDNSYICTDCYNVKSIYL